MIWQSYSQDDIIVLGIINTLNQTQINNFVEENSITFPIVFDPGSPGGVQGGETYDLYYMPNNGSPYPRDFIVDHEGILQYANNEIDTEWMMFVLDEITGGYCSEWGLADVNNDNMTDILDIVLITNFILLVISPDECSTWSSDLNIDGMIDVLDIILIVNMILD